MRWHPLETDLLGGLATLAEEPGPRYLAGPEGKEDEAGLLGLVLAEGRAYHGLERDVATRRLAAAEAEARALAGGVEHDRTGRPGPRSLPGHEAALERVAATRVRLAEHEAALARLAPPAGEEEARRVLARFEVRPRREIEALKAKPGEGALVEVFADGYALRPSPAERLAARREFLGLPPGRDWS